MRIGSKRLAFITAACLALCAVCPLSASGFESDPPGISTEATGLAGRAALEVRVFGDSGELEGLYGGAEVFMSRARLMDSFSSTSPFFVTSFPRNMFS